MEKMNSSGLWHRRFHGLDAWADNGRQCWPSVLARSCRAASEAIFNNKFNGAFRWGSCAYPLKLFDNLLIELNDKFIVKKITFMSELTFKF